MPSKRVAEMLRWDSQHTVPGHIMASLQSAHAILYGLTYPFNKPEHTCEFALEYIRKKFKQRQLPKYMGGFWTARAIQALEYWSIKFPDTSLSEVKTIILEAKALREAVKDG